MHVHNVAAQRTSFLTSNSWGISRRARYSLASLVFISSRIPTEIATYPKPFLMPWNVSAPSGTLWWKEEQETGFPLSAFFSLVCGLHQIPAGDATSPPSWCGCVARPSSLLPPFATSAHHVCLALAQRVCHQKTKQNQKERTSSAPLLLLHHLNFPAWELGGHIQAWLITLERTLKNRYEIFDPAALILCSGV